MTASEHRHLNDRLLSQRVATGVVASVAAAVLFSVGLKWQLPVLTMPSLKENQPNAAVVTFVKHLSPIASSGSKMTRHLAQESPVTVPIPDSTPVPEPPIPNEQPPRMHTPTHTTSTPTKASQKQAKLARLKPATSRPTATRPTPTSSPLKEESDRQTNDKGLTQPNAGGTPSGASNASSVSALADTLAKLTQVVNQHKRYPRRARAIGAEGTVTLGISIDTKGIVTHIVILHSSNVGSLDRAALKAGQSLLGLQTSIRDAMTIQLPMQFALEN